MPSSAAGPVVPRLVALVPDEPGALRRAHEPDVLLTHIKPLDVLPTDVVNAADRWSVSE